MKRTINLAKRNVLDLERDIEQDGLSQVSRDARPPNFARVCSDF